MIGTSENSLTTKVKESFAGLEEDLIDGMCLKALIALTRKFKQSILPISAESQNQYARGDS